MDLLPLEYKQQVKEKYEKHIDWLKTQDHLTRATKGYQSALDYLFRRDKSEHLKTFFNETRKYDKIRNETFTDTFPEWKELFDKYETSKT